MKIEGNKIVKIEESDIINGTFELPSGVTVVGKSACVNNSKITKIPYGIVAIENHAFERCFSLIEIPDSVTTVGEYAFLSCVSIKNMPDSIATIGSGAFINCSSLKNVSKGLTVIPEIAFSRCYGLEIIPDGVTSVGVNAFQFCSSLTQLPDTIMFVDAGAFHHCSNLKNVPNGLTSIPNSAFCGCEALEIIPNGVVTVGVESFRQCISLKQMPDSITTVGNDAFANCSSLEKMSDSIVTAGKSSFFHCSSLKNISPGLTEILDFTFYHCYHLKSIPDGVRVVGDYAFSNCESLQEMPDSIQEIGENAFENCTSLVKISNGLVHIPESSFSCCESLKEMPDSILTVGQNSFLNCSSLEKLSNQLKVVKSSAFANCTSLSEIPSCISVIEDFTFSNCKSLKTISLDNIQNISENSFRGSSITKIITPYGEIKSDSMDSMFFLHNYLFLYANSLLKIPYNDLDEFFSNEDIRLILQTNDFFYIEDGILKFQNLFLKMRRKWDIGHELFYFLKLSTVQEFDLKTWDKIKNLFPYKTSPEMSQAFAEIMEVFGVFKKDENRNNRILTLQDFFDNPSRILENSVLTWLKEHHSHLIERINAAFQKMNISYYSVKYAIDIPKEFQVYLDYNMSEEQVRLIKKLSGTYGKQINDYLKEYYEKSVVQRNVFTRAGKQDEEIKNILFFLDSKGSFHYHSLHRIFDGCTGSFNPEFYEFFIDNLPFILNDSILQSYVKFIQKNFSEIQKYYAYTSGTKTVNLKQVMDYLTGSEFRYHPGNKEMVDAVKRSGVVSQEAFNYYQEAFEKNQVRRKTSLIKRKNIYDIDGFKIKAELLRKDEIEAALVGEVNNTNCCQRYGGVGHNCMAHAIYSDDGGVFVTKLIEDGKEILLTQSWDWQNNNVYCHDNIESTPYLDNNKKLRAAVAKVFQLDGEFIIEKSKNEVESYITARKKTIERSLMSEVEKEKEFSLLREMEKRQVIRVVTSGAGNDDLGLSEYFTSSIEVNVPLLLNGQTFILANFQPVAYNNQQVYFDEKHSAYTDSDERQYIIAGSLENLCLGKQEPLVPIYRDERRVVVEEKVRDYTFHKVQTIEKEAYPEEMQQHQDIGRNQFIEDDQNVYLGEDWYMIYEKKNDQTIYISDLAKINPSIEDESGEQIREMSTAINNLLEQYEVIEADLKEDTSYLLYLMNKKGGYIEQIGSDERYSFGDDSDGKVVTEEEQQEILQNMKDIRASKNPENRMHHVTFKKGPRWKTEQDSKKL